MNLRSFVLPVMLAASWIVACSDSSDSPANNNKADAADDADSGSFGIPCDDSGSLNLAGTWALLARYSLALEGQQGGVVPMCPAEQTGPANLLALLEIQPSGDGSFETTATACRLELPSVSAMVGDCKPEASNLLTMQIPLPDRLIDSFASIPPTTASGNLDLSSSASQPPILLDPIGFAWGTRGYNLPSWQPELDSQCGLSNTSLGRTSACEELCVDDCGALVDDDQDGFPGVTVHLCGTTVDERKSQLPCNAEAPNTPGMTVQGKMSMAIRTEIKLNGAALSSCEAGGEFESDTAFSVVGADVYVTNMALAVASVIKSLPTFRGQQAGSLWRMVRVDGQFGAPNWQLSQDPSARCAEARYRRNELE